jgi:polysaccharide deacetylase family protein (PEP-CTERM system associated)
VTRHGLSFDVEDWQQLVALRLDGTIGEPSSDIDECVPRILDLCEQLDVKATFFVLGMLAKSRPRLVRSIAAHGHEIASHSLNHKLLYRMTRSELLDDLRGSKRLLEDLAGGEVKGFRAPEFSVQGLDSPCFEALIEAGFTYDSSVFPVPQLRYGVTGAPHLPFEIQTRSGVLVELPLATARVGPWRIPIAGGSHFRLLPTWFVKQAASRADERDEPLVFYFHPYEFTRRWLYAKGGFARNRIVGKYVALHNFATWRIERSLRALSEQLDFVPLRDLAVANARSTGRTPS